jgi:hypothetical protein
MSDAALTRPSRRFPMTTAARVELGLADGDQELPGHEPQEMPASSAKQKKRFSAHRIGLMLTDQATLQVATLRRDPVFSGSSINFRVCIAASLRDPG